MTSESVANPSSSLSSPSSITTRKKSDKELVQDALDGNKRLQQIFTHRAEQLEADLKEADSLLDDASAGDTQVDPESEVVIPGAKKATNLFPLTELLNPDSPFYEEAIKRSNYLTNTNVHPMKEKDLEVLADAVRRENQRLQAYKSRTQGPHSLIDTTIDLENNVDGLDWTRIAERVSDASSVKRTAIDCRVCWIGDRHPRINHGEWTAPEIAKLSELVSELLEEKSTVDWVEVAKQLGTNRTPLDCLRHGLPRQRHSWTPELDQILIDSVKSCGIDNWQLVARNVSPHATAAQCQIRWSKTLDPALRRGNWTEEEEERLRKAVAGYGSSWIQVASAISGRTNDQCREKWHEQVNSSTEKSAWTEAEDKTLLENVKLIGNRWKSISLKIGNNRTGPACRLRYDKLMKLQNAQNDATPGPSNTELQPVSATQVSEDGPSSATQTQPCSSTVEGVPTSLARPRPKPRPTGKGKAKATEVSSTGESQITSIESTTMNELTTMPTASMPKPRPITRAKGKTATIKKTSTSLENVPESADNMQDTPIRGSKRSNITQLDEAPAPKKRKTRAPKPASIPASEPVEPAIASASMSLPQSAESTFVAIDVDEAIQEEHDPAPTTKRILRKRKTVTSATVEKAGGVSVKRSRGKTRK